MTIRQKFNGVVREEGNRIKEGLGDILTREIKLSVPLAVAGAAGGIALWGAAITSEMSNMKIYDLMYGNTFGERFLGATMSVPYIATYLVIVPMAAGLGAIIGNCIGKQIDRI